MKFIFKYRIFVFAFLSFLVVLFSSIYLSDLSIYSFHRLCPLSGGCSFFKTMEKGVVYPIGTIIFITLFTTAMVLRRMFCSFICPIGFISEILALPRKLIFRKQLKRTTLSYRFTVASRITVLLFMLFLPFFTGIFSFQTVCPITLFGDVIHIPLPSASLVTILLLITLSVLFERFFCRVICPLGFLMGIAGKIGNRFLPTRTIHIQCGIKEKCCCCRKACPMGIELSDQPIDHIDCILCEECYKVCPRKKRGIS